MTAKTLLTAKQRRGGPAAQVQTLVRIARRATCHGDWMRTFLDNSAPHYQSADEQRRLHDEIDKSEARALAATIELSQIVVDNPDYPHWTLTQKAAAARFLKGTPTRPTPPTNKQATPTQGDSDMTTTKTTTKSTSAAKKTAAKKTVAQRKSDERNEKTSGVAARIKRAVDETVAAEKTIADAAAAVSEPKLHENYTERLDAAKAEAKLVSAAGWRWNDKTKQYEKKSDKAQAKPSSPNLDAINAGDKGKKTTSSSSTSSTSSAVKSEPIAPLVDRNVKTIKCVACGETKESSVFPTRGSDKRATECRECGRKRRGQEPTTSSKKSAAKSTSAAKQTTPKGKPASEQLKRGIGVKTAAKKTAAKKTTKAA